MSFCERLWQFCLWRNITQSLNHILPARPAPDTSGRPLGCLPSLGCLSLGWVWAGAGLNYPRATGQSQLDPHCQGTPSLIEGIRTGQRARNWPGQRDILTHLPSILPHCLLHPQSPLPLECQSFSPMTLREEKDVTYHPFLTHSLPLLSCHWPPQHTQHTQTHTAPSSLCCDMELMDYFSNWFQKCT